MRQNSIKKLTKEQRQKLMLGLCEAIANMKTMEEAANLLSDLLSSQEQEMLAKRLQIAKLLLRGKIYEDIIDELKVGAQTVARVNAWLNESGIGYRLVFKRQNRKNQKVSDYMPVKRQWDSLKRHYPMYYWPQLLLEDIVRSANNRQRHKLLNTLKVLKKSRQKYTFFKEIEKILIESNPRKSKYISNI